MMIKDLLPFDDEHPPLDQQEFFILGPYIDLIELEDSESFNALAEHAGIVLDEEDPLRSILQHYWLGGGFYDLDKAVNDLTTFPAMADCLLRRGSGQYSRKLN